MNKQFKVLVDPNIPKDIIYFFDENVHHSYRIDTRSRWQKFKDRVKRIFT